MVDLTHGGMWVRWGSLDGTDKMWFAASCAGTIIAAFIVLLPQLGDAYGAGFRLGSGGGEVGRTAITNLVANDVYSRLLLVAMVAAVFAAMAWWRFSRRQDEMFNRVQNYAIGHGAAWAIAIGLLWWMASLADIVAILSLRELLIVAFGLSALFWIIGVRRWA